MGPMLFCITCRRWRLVLENNVTYCSACARPLQTEDFEELLDLDDEAAKECPELLERWRYEVGYALALMFGVAMFTENWIPAWIELTLMEGLLLASMITIVGRHRDAKALLRAKYERLWAIPTIFRSSVPKP